jgi:hypothetical protein
VGLKLVEIERCPREARSDSARATDDVWPITLM